MLESAQERLARLKAWLVDLDLLIDQAKRAQDKAALEAAEIMRSECQKFIAETQKEIEGARDKEASKQRRAS